MATETASDNPGLTSTPVRDENPTSDHPTLVPSMSGIPGCAGSDDKVDSGNAAVTTVLGNGVNGSLLIPSSVFNPVDTPVVPPLQIDGNGVNGSLLIPSSVFNPVDTPVVPPLQVDGGVANILTYTNGFNRVDSSSSLQEDRSTEVLPDHVGGVVPGLLDRDANFDESSSSTPGENVNEPVSDYFSDGEVFLTDGVPDDVDDVADSVVGTPIEVQAEPGRVGGFVNVFFRR